MAIEKQTKQIGECSYEVTPFGAKIGNRVLLKVIKSIAPIYFVAAAAGGLKAIGTEGVASALAGVDEDEFEWIVEKFASSTDVIFADGRRPTLHSVYDMHFAGRYLEELDWLEFVIEVNFGPFFQELKRKAAAKAKLANAKAPSSSTSPTT